MDKLKKNLNHSRRKLFAGLAITLLTASVAPQAASSSLKSKHSQATLEQNNPLSANKPLSLEQRVRQLMIVSNVASEHTYGGLMLYNKHMDQDLCALKKSRYPNTLFMVDHEGGTVNRLNSDLESASRVGKKERDIINYKEKWKKDAAQLKNKCFDVVLGPTVDTRLGPRSYSSDFSYNYHNVAAPIAHIIEKQKLIPVVKHFPGELNDCKAPYTKKEMRVCPQNLEQIHAQWKSFKGSTVPALMISTYIYTGVSDLPAASSSIYYKYLRQDLGYEGVIMTDALWEMSIPTTPAVIWEIFKNADMTMIMDPKAAEAAVAHIIDKLKSDPQEINNLKLKEARINKFIHNHVLDLNHYHN